MQTQVQHIMGASDLFSDSTLNKHHSTALNCKRELKSPPRLPDDALQPFLLHKHPGPDFKRTVFRISHFSLLLKGFGMESDYATVPFRLTWNDDTKDGGRHAHEDLVNTARVPHVHFNIQSWTALECKLALICWTIQSHQNKKMFYCFLSSLASRASPSVASRASPSVVVLSADLLPDSRSSAI